MGSSLCTNDSLGFVKEAVVFFYAVALMVSSSKEPVGEFECLAHFFEQTLESATVVDDDYSCHAI